MFLQNELDIPVNAVTLPVCARACSGRLSMSVRGGVFPGRGNRLACGRAHFDDEA
jgi:hypothetical protein